MCESCGPSGGPGIYIGLSAFVSTQPEIQRLSRSSEVEISVHDMKIGSLALALDKITQEQLLVPVRRLGETVTFTKSGPLEEILQDFAIKIAE